MNKKMDSIKSQEDALFEKWRNFIPKLVSDGVANETEYLSSQFKILYLLKEVNGGENWDLREFIMNGGRPRTWDNIARWTEGILNLDKDHSWEELDKNTEHRRKQYLPKICAMNLKKTSGTYTSISRQIKNAAEDYKHNLKEQLAIYKPDIIICCGTCDEYVKIMYENKKPDWKMTKRGIWFIREENKIIISFAHPESRIKSCLLYYALIDAIKEIFDVTV